MYNSDAATANTAPEIIAAAAARVKAKNARRRAEAAALVAAELEKQALEAEILAGVTPGFLDLLAK